MRRQVGALRHNLLIFQEIGRGRIIADGKTRASRNAARGPRYWRPGRYELPGQARRACLNLRRDLNSET